MREDQESEDSDGNTAQTVSLQSKRKGSSIIWQYFGFKKEDDAQSEVIYRTCGAKVLTSKGNTTNLFQHLKNHHKTVYDGCMAKIPTRPKAPQQASLKVMFENVTPYERTSKRHREITQAIAEYLAKDMLPFNSVSGSGFMKMVNVLDKRYSIPARTYFSQVAIPELYKKCKHEVMMEIQAAGFFAGTTDLWTSRASEPYQSLTVHFITEDFDIKARCLQTAYFPDDHTGENIAASLREGLSCWNLPEEKLVCITTDNASNMVKAAELNEWTRLQCFGHRLHLAIENALKEVDDKVSRATGLCRKLVGHFSHSSKKKIALAEAQRQLNLPEHCLIVECQTRWGSKEKMIQRVLEQAKAISKVLSGTPARTLIPTWQDMDVLESIHKALHPLLEFTDALSGEEYVSISYLKPVLHHLATSVLADDAEDTELTKSIKSKVQTYLENKYSCPITQELLDVASFLDPRFKTKYTNTDKIPIIKSRLKTEMLDILRQEKRSRTESAHGPQSAHSSGAKGKKSIGSLFKSSASASDVSSVSVQPEDVVEAEFCSYLLAPLIDGEDDPLKWWKEYKFNFPHLSKMARKYLCIPATSAASERLFSTGGNIVTCTRASLKPANVDMLVFLAKNL
ncbi:E3 SUMO-protein ligase ZBED1-like [Acanthochromis polyacanthus]|uniref:E3 SUMO-protein ligase ZBED1-like n=2 Tax=Acanthochromis polyacanthus TaxID=80966 RepID=UPI002234C10D|nr:E3 SUMO-protein ligase ZBED1-like [Acanthochromis polyacanthus]